MDGSERVMMNSEHFGIVMSYTEDKGQLQPLLVPPHEPREEML
jgi:hypothetical protein